MPGGTIRPFVLAKTYVAWCHGDLHSRNILVDDSGHGWLIDFARSKKSHVLRDFIELETDIKFALLPTTQLDTLISLETRLLVPATLSQALPDSIFADADTQKAYRAVATIRTMAYRLLG